MNFVQSGKTIGASSTTAQVISASISKTAFTYGDEITYTIKIKNTSSATYYRVLVGLVAVYDGSTYEFGVGTADTTWKTGVTKTFKLTAKLNAGHSPHVATLLQTMGERCGAGLMLNVGVQKASGFPTYELWNLPLTYVYLDKYYMPFVPTLGVKRWDLNDDAASDEGQNVALTAQVGYDSAPPAGTFSVSLRYLQDGDVTPTTGTAIDLTAAESDLLAGVADDTSLIDPQTLFIPGSGYTFILCYGDAYEMAYSAAASIAEAFANVHLAGCGKGVAFGKFSSSTAAAPLFECEYPSEFASSVDVSGALDVGGALTVAGQTKLDGNVIAKVGGGKLLKIVSYTTTMTVASGTSYESKTVAASTIQAAIGSGYTAIGVVGWNSGTRLWNLPVCYVSSNELHLTLQRYDNGNMSSNTNVDVVVRLLCLHTG